jgi:hypothetical protein
MLVAKRSNGGGYLGNFFVSAKGVERSPDTKPKSCYDFFRKIAEFTGLKTASQPRLPDPVLPS